jgi:hypothetical protein
MTFGFYYYYHRTSFPPTRFDSCTSFLDELHITYIPLRMPSRDETGYRRTPVLQKERQTDLRRSRHKGEGWEKRFDLCRGPSTTASALRTDTRPLSIPSVPFSLFSIYTHLLHKSSSSRIESVTSISISKKESPLTRPGPEKFSPVVFAMLFITSLAFVPFSALA